MKKNYFDISLISVSKRKKVYLDIFPENMLDYSYFDLDNFPKEFLTENLLDIMSPDFAIYEILSDAWDRFCNKINAKYFDSEEYWECAYKIYMFNINGRLIGNIIRVDYNEIIYGNLNNDYDILIDKVFEAIIDNAGNSNRCFYICVSDNIEEYTRIDMHEFWLWRIYGLRR